MSLVFDEIAKAVGYLLIAGIVAFVWKTARDSACEVGTKKTLWKGFLWCAGIALFASITLGNPTCEEVSDPVRGGCDSYADDGWEPTTEQRLANFAYFMTLLYVPVVIGAYQSKNGEKSIN